jgi:hypothetical protein
VNYSKLIIIASHVPIFVAAGYAARIYRSLEKELKIFSWFLIVSGTVQLVSLLLWWNGINNMPLLHLYAPAGFVLLGCFYNATLRGLIHTRIIIIAIAGFVILSVLNSAFLQPLLTFNSYALTLQCVLMVILSLTASFIFLDRSVVESRGGGLASLNFINAGILIYYSSALLIFYFGDLITHRYSITFSRYAWIAHSFLSMVMYICFIFGLWKRPAK